MHKIFAFTHDMFITLIGSKQQLLTCSNFAKKFDPQTEIIYGSFVIPLISLILVHDWSKLAGLYIYISRFSLGLDSSFFWLQWVLN